jgi:hypothetical protein
MQWSAIKPSLRGATKWKSCTLCSYPDSKTAFRWFIDTKLTYCLILYYYIVQRKKYRSGGTVTWTQFGHPEI